jgi:predicted hotdog family 3-hydroxylacyl-ACP dehydratase
MGFALEQLIPHRAPMLLIDRLIKADSSFALAEKTFTNNDYGVENGTILEVALLECMAQTTAAGQGNKALKRGETPGQGMLVGVDHFEWLSPVALGIKLEISALVTRQIGPFYLTDSTIHQDGNLIAKGTLKFYIAEED